MTTPSPTDPDQVSVSQGWLNFVGEQVATANSVLGPYIQSLINGESVTLAPADVSAVTAALAGLASIEPQTPPAAV